VTVPHKFYSLCSRHSRYWRILAYKQTDSLCPNQEIDSTREAWYDRREVRYKMPSRKVQTMSKFSKVATAGAIAALLSVSTVQAQGVGVGAAVGGGAGGGVGAGLGGLLGGTLGVTVGLGVVVTAVVANTISNNRKGPAATTTTGN
jgi:hypothetical protein